MTPLGQPVSLTITIVDQDGIPADPTSLTLTITDAFGTVLAKTLAEVSRDGIGVYRYEYIPTTEGLHSVRWAAAGASIATAPPVDSFYIEGAALPPIVGLDEAREWTGNRSGSAQVDADLAEDLMIASSLAELVTGATWRRREVVEQIEPDVFGRAWTRYRPIVEVASVDGSAPIDGSVTYGLGLIRTPTIGRPVEVDYTAGPVGGAIPFEVRRGVLEMLRHLGATRAQGTGNSRVKATSGGETFAGYLVPYRVLELWHRHQFGGLG